MIGFVYSHTDLKNTSSSVYVGNFDNLANSLKFDNFEINAKYQFTKNAYIGGMYNYTRGRFNSTAGNVSPKWQQVGLMVDYQLSSERLVCRGMYQHLSVAPIASLR